MTVKLMNGNENDENNFQSDEARVFLQNGENLVVEELSINLKDTTCGLWCFKGSCLQLCANKKAYVILYGLLGCIFSASYAYFNGTITTLEKRFKIPSRTTGIISVGNDLSQLLMSVILSYYTGRGHRPRWMALGMYTVVLFCLLTALPHFLYGPGFDALSLTKEYQIHENSSNAFIFDEERKFLCNNQSRRDPECDVEHSGSFSPQVILFIAQFISGIGGSLYYTLGVSYMDDNIKRSKTPALFSFSYFLRMLGPAIGHGLASICLKVYISPTLNPTIDNKDPRWLGAWWLGWIILALILFVFSSLLALFPKTLPRAAVRKEIRRQASRISAKPMDNEPEPVASFKDMIKTFQRLANNRTLMLNNFAAVFYFLGYMPYWIFLPKYIETQYRQSASASSFVTGTAGLVFSAIGILLSGVVITQFKPRARYLAAWNVIVGAISVMGIISYAYLGCTDNDNRAPLLPNGQLNPISECNSHCHCDYVKYNPVCSSDGRTTFVSSCHAGCRKVSSVNGTDIFSECSCIRTDNKVNTHHYNESNETSSEMYELDFLREDFVRAGSCPVDCLSQFYMFLCVVCVLKFSGATGRASNFLVTVRCVDEKDKPVAMGFGLMLMSLCAFVPSPILFGIIMDKACLVWGRTCNGYGNCWLYNGQTLRYTVNFTAAAFVLIGTLFDAGVCYYVKDLQIFDEEFELEEDINTPLN